MNRLWKRNANKLNRLTRWCECNILICRSKWKEKNINVATCCCCCRVLICFFFCFLCHVHIFFCATEVKCLFSYCLRQRFLTICEPWQAIHNFRQWLTALFPSELVDSTEKIMKKINFCMLLIDLFFVTPLTTVEFVIKWNWAKHDTNAWLIW